MDANTHMSSQGVRVTTENGINHSTVFCEAAKSNCGISKLKVSQTLCIDRSLFLGQLRSGDYISAS